MAILNVQTTANGLPSLLHLYVSITRADGSPVTGLTGSHFSVHLSWSPVGAGVAVPTTFMLPVFDADGNPVLDDEGNPVQEQHSAIMPLGLPGFYGLSVNPGPSTGFYPNSGAAYVLQVRVVTGSDMGQAVVAAM